MKTQVFIARNINTSTRDGETRPRNYGMISVSLMTLTKWKWY